MAGATQVRSLSAYAGVGTELIHFRVDTDAAQLERRGSIRLPSRVQFVTPHASLPILYAATADRTPGAEGQPFFLCALRRDEQGDLSMIGEPVLLPARPIHLTTDRDSKLVFVAFSNPAGLTVRHLAEDGGIGDEIPVAEGFDPGSAPHQVRVMPSNDRAIIVARGKKGFGKPDYVGGSLNVFRWDRGQVENAATVAPDLPRGFNPRNVDFHPTQPWMFLSLEEQNELCVLRYDGERIDPQALFTADILADRDNRRPNQDAGALRVHPSGRFVYVGNRNHGYAKGAQSASWLTPDPVPLFGGGENSIAVFAIDQATGAPTRLQVEDSRGIHPREFALDPDGRLLIIGNLAPTIFEQDGARTDVPAGLALFRVGDDGRLEFVRRHGIDVAPEMLWWMGLAV